MSRKLKRFWLGLTILLALVLVIVTVHFASIPQRYALSPGDASPYDITAPRSIRDQQETALRAAQAASEVPDVMLRSDQIVSEVKEDVESFITVVESIRLDPPLPTPTPLPELDEDALDENDEAAPDEEEEEEERYDPALVAEQIIVEIQREHDLILSQDEAETLATISDDRFASIVGHMRSVTSLIMAETVDRSGLRSSLADKIESLQESMTFYQEDAELIERMLSSLLRPNVVFDPIATENARQAAYDTVQNNPVMIERGTRLVSLGEIITDDTYALLMELTLIDDGSFDYLHFAGIALLVLLLLAIGWTYLVTYERERLRFASDLGALLLALLIPFLVSAYIGRQAPLVPPVYFAAVLIAVYFGFRCSVIVSLLLTALIFPMTNFNPLFLLVAISGSLVAALFTKGIIRKDNYAFIIVATSLVNVLVTLAYGLLQKESGSAISLNSAFTAFSGALSVIAAIGIMPLFEMLFNTVSPLRLIELSQPGHPLLRRLFVEAPGSSQHSMMVANLADAAAQSIGADPLLSRVGAYYHDIGKLENPEYFIENQKGENPHDHMLPDQSADIILRHPEKGVRIGKRYRLPPAILRIIHEHHGSSQQAYFLHKAKKMADEGKMAPPDPDQYRYHCPLPSSRESAIVMLADSLEAAMKSMNLSSLSEVEDLLRKIIKTKNDQEQFAQSGLSFKDLELIVKAFLQVYGGHFHERIAYPDDRTSPQQAK